MGENSSDDIDPALLREAGRASAIQDLANQGQRLADRAEAWEKATKEDLLRQIRKDRRSKRWLGLALVVLAFGVWDGRLAVGELKGIAEDTQEIGENNAEILENVDSLVKFVDEVEADREDGRDPQTAAIFQAILETRELVCASSDPALQARCAELGGEDTSGPGGGPGEG